MDKIRLIKGVHRILFVYEDGNYDKYYAYLSHEIIKLSEYDNNVIEQNVGLLKGLKKLGNEVTHFDVRQTALHIMNDMDRRL